MTVNPVRILHQADVEAVVNARVMEIEAGDTVFGTAASVDVGTAASEVPTNGDLGGASLLEVGTTTGTVAAGDDARIVAGGTATQPGDLGGAAVLDVGSALGTVAAGDDVRFSSVWSAPITSTTAALTAIANAVNTTDKVAGKQVFNTDTGLPVYATGAAAADVWNNAAGALAHTPA